ncbi:MAG: helix-turn-helix transcriptional regulator [Bacteroidales bacterium]|jgi:transcriptional regulator with XRE-family HTH domain|nr:helix-turn-helix transcriptional regulator [Bacteroidales bacterium]
MNTIRERLSDFLHTHQLSASEFADIIGVQRSSVSHILSERNKPSIDFLIKMLNSYPSIDVNWLLTGSHTVGRNVSPTSESTNSSGISQDEEQVSYVKSSPEINIEGELKNKKIEKIVVFYSDDTFKEYIKE